MSLESLAGGMNEMKSTQGDGGNAMKFDPDKRMDVNDNRISDLDNETKFDPDKRIESDKNQLSPIKDMVTKDTNEITTINEPIRYHDLDTMKRDLGKGYNDQKPPRSPDIEKWFNNGGIIKIEEDGKQSWTYIDSEKREVSYVDGYPVFPPEGKHPVIGDINIGKFTGDKNIDKKLYKEKLLELYGLIDIPDGYDLHHDSENGNMQLVKSDWHRKFPHIGGHYKFKEAE